MAASEDKEAKTEAATPRRIDDAVKKGNTPVSRELGNLAALTGLALAIPLVSAFFASHLLPSMIVLMERAGEIRIGQSEDAVILLVAVVVVLAKSLALPLLLLMALGIAVALVQNPLAIAWDRIKPEWSRISAVKGFERIFGAMGRIEFLKTTLKLVAITGVAAASAMRFDTVMVNALTTDVAKLPDKVATEVGSLVHEVIGLLLVIAILDLAWTRFKWHIDLRMSKQEIKDEMKQSEGDPIVRARQRSLARDRARRQMMAKVPRATLVIANPTHYAVALRYVRGESETPLVVARGVDNIAMRIRTIAEENDIPVIEDRALARSLYEAVSIDRPIPPAFYKAVAEIIVFLMSQRKTSAPIMRRAEA